MTFFLISIKGSSKLLLLLGRTGGFGLLRIIFLIFIYLILHSMIFFICGLTDKDDAACPRYPQSQDSFGYHIFMNHIFKRKSILHNMIRDEICRILQEEKSSLFIGFQSSLARLARSAPCRYSNDSYSSL